jgi:hypothetical protein
MFDVLIADVSHALLSGKDFAQSLDSSRASSIASYCAFEDVKASKKNIAPISKSSNEGIVGILSRYCVMSSVLK